MISIIRHKLYGKNKSIVEDFTRTPWQHRPITNDTENFFITKDKETNDDKANRNTIS